MKFHLIIQNIKNRMPLILVDSILKDFILVDKRKSELVIEGNSEWFYPLHLETVKWYRLSNAFVHCLIVSFNVIDWAWVMMFATTVVHWQILVNKNTPRQEQLQMQMISDKYFLKSFSWDCRMMVWMYIYFKKLFQYNFFFSIFWSFRC